MGAMRNNDRRGSGAFAHTGDALLLQYSDISNRSGGGESRLLMEMGLYARQMAVWEDIYSLT